MQLLKHPRFLDEYKRWNEKISRIIDEDKKSEMIKLMQQLVSEVQKLDTQHDELLIKPSLNSSVGETRQSVTTIRRKIHSNLQNLENMGLIEKEQ